MNGWLRYAGSALTRVLSHLDLSQLGADAKELEALGENAAVTFVKGVAQHVEPGLAAFIAGHPALQDEFHTLTDDEAAAEVAQRKGDPSPAGDTSALAPSSSTSEGTDQSPEPSSSGSASGDSTPSAQ
jgi:hypothetical protein